MYESRATVNATKMFHITVSDRVHDLPVCIHVIVAEGVAQTEILLSYGIKHFIL
jgi:hypothetical protein